MSRDTTTQGNDRRATAARPLPMDSRRAPHAFQAIGIAAVAAAAMKRPAPRPEARARDVPPCLRKDQFED